MVARLIAPENRRLSRRSGMSSATESPVRLSPAPVFANVA